jgi:hypothetical protein
MSILIGLTRHDGMALKMLSSGYPEPLRVPAQPETENYILRGTE